MPKELPTTALVFLGGALGSGLRFSFGLQIEPLQLLFLVNLLGTLLLGVVNGKTWPSWVHPLVGTGVAGGFTTLSGLSLFLNEHLATDPLATLVPIAVMFALGFVAHWAGMKLAVIWR
ncbi:unannotated protein [freshwater metagenome]|uniref:Unannotated protein n=1 Tax=freshwater metagenome TaxID=449393 RepID=A0A6J7JQF0_9ZZZZ|nr:hypothetical protein [Actinomycetota bacterium]